MKTKYSGVLFVWNNIRILNITLYRILRRNEIIKNFIRYDIFYKIDIFWNRIRTNICRNSISEEHNFTEPYDTGKYKLKLYKPGLL